MDEPTEYFLSVRVRRGERDRLLALAERHGRAPYSVLIRQALNEFMDRVEAAEKKNEGSAVVSEAASATLLNEQPTYNQTPLR